LPLIELMSTPRAVETPGVADDAAGEVAFDHTGRREFGEHIGVVGAYALFMIGRRTSVLAGEAVVPSEPATTLLLGARASGK